MEAHSSSEKDISLSCALRAARVLGAVRPFRSKVVCGAGSGERQGGSCSPPGVPLPSGRPTPSPCCPPSTLLGPPPPPTPTLPFWRARTHPIGILPFLLLLLLLVGCSPRVRGPDPDSRCHPNAFLPRPARITLHSLSLCTRFPGAHQGRFLSIVLATPACRVAFCDESRGQPACSLPGSQGNGSRAFTHPKTATSFARFLEKQTLSRALGLPVFQRALPLVPMHDAHFRSADYSIQYPRTETLFPPDIAMAPCRWSFCYNRRIIKLLLCSPFGSSFHVWGQPFQELSQVIPLPGRSR